MGFTHTPRAIPTIMQTFRDAGYLTGVLGKVPHSRPHANYQFRPMKWKQLCGRTTRPIEGRIATAIVATGT